MLKDISNKTLFILSFFSRYMTILDIVEEARASVGDYCSEECNNYCCRVGFLSLNKDSLELMRPYIKDEDSITKNEDGLFSLKLKPACPCLIDSRCAIHSEEKRSKPCKEFPVFLYEDKKLITISSKCPAVKDNKLYGYIHLFRQQGYEVRVSDVTHDFE